MKIGIEAQRIFRKNKHGMDFVVLEVIKELQRFDHENEYFIFVSSGEDKCLLPSKNVHIVEINYPSYPLWEQVGLPCAVAKINLDILHCTSNTAPIYCNTPLVVTLHDIIFLEPKQSGNKSWYQNLGRIYRRIVVPKILHKCKKIITVSNFECNRISEYLQFPKDIIISIYNGYSNHFKVIEDESIYEITKKYIKEKEYIFFLGNTDPKKNVPRTLKAYSEYLAQSERKLPLLIADIKEDVLCSILKEQEIEHIRQYITCPGYISNFDLAYLYNGAWAFLYTSLRESFGIPMLEAMACGTPVITGNVSAMPEIAGEGGLLVDTFSSQAISSTLLELENNVQLYNNQVSYGLERVKLYSWSRTAKELLAIYNEVYAETHK